MPSWIKKRFCNLKQDLLNNIVALKGKKELLPITGNNNESPTKSDKLPIQKIRNDLKSNQYRAKSNMNRFRDYTKWHDQILVEQNNCALRCVREEKFINSDVNHTNTDDAIEIESRHNRNDNINNKPVLTDVGDANNEICDSESEGVCFLFNELFVFA